MKTNTFDKSLAITFFALLFVGIIMISSVSVYESYGITQRLMEEGVLTEPSNSFYLWRHFKRALLAIPLFFLGMYLPLSFWKRLAPPLFLVTWLLLIVVLIPGVSGDATFSSRSWINLPGIPSIQPVELVKLSLIFYLGVWMEKRQEIVRSFQYGFLPFTMLLSMVVVLLALQPDYGSSLVIVSTAACMFFAAGGGVLHIGFGALCAILLSIPLVLLTGSQHVIERFQVFLDPSLDPGKVGFQVKQALMAIGNGGFFGVGFGKSMQKFGYLPEVQGDSIFAAISEELGFIRVIFVVGAYAYIAYKGYKIAIDAKDRFSMLVAVGISSWFMFQAVINIGGNLAILPLTGITLPLVSYGGTSLMISMLAAGVLLNISRFAYGATRFTGRRRVGRAHRPSLRPRLHA